MHLDLDRYSVKVWGGYSITVVFDLMTSPGEETLERIEVILTSVPCPLFTLQVLWTSNEPNRTPIGFRPLKRFVQYCRLGPPSTSFYVSAFWCLATKMVSLGMIDQVIIQIIWWIRTKVVAGLQQTSYLMDKCPRRIAAMLALAIAEIA